MKTIVLSLLAVTLCASARAQQGSTLATEADRAVFAPLGPTPVYALKKAAKAALSNGLALSLIESHRLPLVAVTLIVPQAGDATDPVGREGLSDFMAAMSKEGVARLPTAAALSDAIDDIGASIEIATSDSGLAVSVLVLKENLDKAMNLVSLMVRKPAYLSGAPEYTQALERMRQRSLAGLEMEKGNPEALAGKRLSSSLFGDGPHGRRQTQESVQAITLRDIAQRQQSTVAPNGAVLAAAGDITLEELKALAGKNFGSWTPSQAPGIAAPHAALVAETTPQAPGLVIELIDLPGEQAEMMLGARTLPRLHPDHDALSLGVLVLGGPMLGRLDQNIRETHSWAYGARASMKAWKDDGAVTMSTKVQLDKTGDALREILAEVKRLSDAPVPDAELLAAKTYIKGGYLRSTRTMADLSSRLAAAETLGLPANSLTDFPARMDALTPAQVQAAARTWLDSSKLKIVIAGPAELIVPQLKGIGTVQLFDAQGRPKTASNG